MKNQFNQPQLIAQNNQATAPKKGNSGSGIGEDMIWI